jgi:hypothetical protein
MDSLSNSASYTVVTRTLLVLPLYVERLFTVNNLSTPLYINLWLGRLTSNSHGFSWQPSFQQIYSDQSIQVLLPTATLILDWQHHHLALIPAAIPADNNLTTALPTPAFNPCEIYSTTYVILACCRQLSIRKLKVFHILLCLDYT